MNLLKSRFTPHLNNVETLLKNAATQENPALWLYQNDLRTPIFMLQSLSRIYIPLAGKKTFTKLKEEFKAVEDQLGQIDYYDAFAKEFAQNKDIPEPVIAYLNQKTQTEITNLSNLLNNKGWLDGTQIKKIQKKLNDQPKYTPKEDIKALRKFYTQEIAKINKFVEESAFHFRPMSSRYFRLAIGHRPLSLKRRSYSRHDP